MTQGGPQFPDRFGVHQRLRPGATQHRAGLTLEQRVAALEQGAASAVLRTKAGIPSDADYSRVPPVGTMVIDTSNNRLYVRTATATWKYTTLT